MVGRGLPGFGLEDYQQLLVDLKGVGYEPLPVTAMADDGEGRSVFLRHDIDIHLPGAELMAAVESDLGARATYYLMLTQHYNLRYSPNLRIVERLVLLGHEIGLHYDLADFPPSVDEAVERLERDVEDLATLVGVPVRTITTHQPHLRYGDPFVEGSRFIHPHDPRWQRGLRYVSDSCRAWRDESLLECFAPDGPERLLLLTHPELWLDAGIADRTAYLEEVLHPNAVRQHAEFVSRDVREIWSRHDGAAAHDAREAAVRTTPHGVAT